MARKRSLPSKRLLSSTRPCLPSNPSSSLSSRATRTLIRHHHTLQKQLHHATATSNAPLASSLRACIAASGGLPAYQQASIQGQSADRGGDSSKVLVGWMREAGLEGIKCHAEDGNGGRERKGRGQGTGEGRRLLEVGALRTDNACAKSGIFERVERIDLCSRHKDILEQDFMERPLPAEDRKAEEGFDVVSLSLVVNYVGDATGRGEMLRRVARFMRPAKSGRGGEDLGESWLPGLFLVLPAPCVENSRYLDERRLEDIMQALGLGLLRRKMSSKLVYYYYRYTGDTTTKSFSKQEVRKGGSRNNFAIVLK